MSNMLRNWIFSVVAGNLAGALKDSRNIEISDLEVRKGNYVYCRDRLVMNVRENRTAQIIKIHSEKGGKCSLTISDGISYIRATTPSGGSNTLHQGGLFSFSEYNLTFDPRQCGSDLELVLNITSSGEFRGFEGSPTFHDPTNILGKSTIQGKLTQLRISLERSSKEPSPISQPASPIQSQISASHSQAGFATQLPGLSLKRQKIEVQIPQKRNSRAADLLMTLGRAPKQKPSAVWQDNAVVDESCTEKCTTPSSVQALTQISEAKALQISSRIDASANAAYGYLSMPSQSPGNFSVEKNLTSTLDSKLQNSPPLSTAEGSEKENSQESTRRKRENAGNEASQDSTRLTKAHSPPFAFEGPPPVLSVDAEINPVQFVDQFLSNNPFAGMKRVPRKYVRVSATQRDLLERKESWYNPSGDSRNSYAIIPANVREDLMKHIGRNSSPEPMCKSTGSTGASEESQSDSSNDSGNESQQSNSKGTRDEKLSPWFGKEHKPDVRSRPRPKRISGKFSRCSSSIDSPVSPSEAVLRHTERLVPLDNSSSEGGNEEDDEDLVSWPSSSPIGQRRQLTRSASPTELDIRNSDVLAEVRQQEEPDTANEYSPEENALPSSLDSILSQRSPKATNIIDHANNTNMAGSPSLQAVKTQWVPMVFPSSPTEDDALEIDDLHAEGDMVEQIEVRNNQIPKVFQEFPSTGPPNNGLIQVEQSPDFCSRLADDIPPCTEASQDEKIKHTDLLSDAIVPATWNPTSTHTQTSNSTQKSSSALLSPSQNSADVPQKRSSRSEVEIQATAPEVMSTQPQHFPAMGSSKSHKSVVISSPPADTPYSRNVARSNANTKQSSPICLSPQPTSPKTRFGPNSPHQSSPIKERSPEINAAANHNKYSLPKHRWLLTESIRREDGTPKDVRAMTRAHRHSFFNHFSTESLRPDDALENGRSMIPINTPVKTLEDKPDILQSASKTVPRAKPAYALTRITSSALDDTEVSEKLAENAIEEHQPVKFTTPVPTVVNVEVRLPSMPENIQQEESQHNDFYTRFRVIYPDYPGSQNDFTWTLVYIEWLRENKKFLHRSLCDDFIRAMASDFVSHSEKAKLAGEKPISGWEFYDQQVQQPEYQEQIINPNNLQEAISSLKQERVEKFRSKFRVPNAAVPAKVGLQYSSPMLALQTGGASDPPFVASSPLRLPKTTLNRRPFFETPSQIAMEKSKTTIVTDPHPRSDVSESNIKSTRQLPWSKEGTPVISESNQALGTGVPAFTSSPPVLLRSSRRSNVEDGRSSPSIPRTNHKLGEKRRRIPTITDTGFQGTPQSPILGLPELGSSYQRSSRKKLKTDRLGPSPSLPTPSKQRTIPDSAGNTPRGTKELRSSPPHIPRSSVTTRLLSTLEKASASRPIPSIVNARSLSGLNCATSKSRSLSQDAEGKVGGWLQDQAPASIAKKDPQPTSRAPTNASKSFPPPQVPILSRKKSFKDFIKKRKESGGFPSFSVRSTPTSTPAKRLCTKEIRKEPETQAWSN
ncbi:hypothetical protein BGZ60DRAFT_232466 [Tricladium varicosporioides]|nr:hypothetical protein BGZ60DRAFT_232466 [Hymenoscyphus varicosporioides]